MRDHSDLLLLGEDLTIKDAAWRLWVTREMLRNWDRTVKLTPKRHPINGDRLDRREDLEALLEQADRGSGPARSC